MIHSSRFYSIILDHNPLTWSKLTILPRSYGLLGPMYVHSLFVFGFSVCLSASSTVKLGSIVSGACYGWARGLHAWAKAEMFLLIDRCGGSAMARKTAP